ncbi:MAG TPA: extracellular solute-binding protein [Candidatus Acidoferrales bacterium]|nr:extracellular solute-binding protein [Candidatus Acidoferrales bacterium]
MLATAAAVAVASAAVTSGIFAAAQSGSTRAVQVGQVPLIVYSAQGYDMNEVAAFQKATGIKTELLCDSTGPLLARIAAERNNPQWGLLWVDGNQPFAELDDEGALVRHYLPAANFNALGKSLLPSDHSYVPTGTTIAATLVYNSAKITNPPKTFEQLLQPQYNGLLGMNNPSVSGPTYPYVAGLMSYLGGVSKGEKFLTKLKANGLQIFDTNGNTLNALQTGQIDMATIQSSAILGVLATNPNYKIAFPKGVTLLPSDMAIDRHASKTVIAEAERFETYVLSKAGQHQMKIGDPHGDSNFWPVVQGGSPKAGVPSLSSIRYQAVNPYTWGPRESSINAWFTANIVS